MYPHRNRPNYHPARPTTTSRILTSRVGRATAGGVALAFVLAACSGGGTSHSGGGYAAASSAPPSAAGTAATVDLHASSLGQVLVDSQGHTLYLFEADKGGQSRCSGACLSAWPPLLSSGAPHAGTGTTSSLLGTSTRNDGGMQVTYAGHPLYYYAGDNAPGDATGQGLNQFGAKWYVVGQDGQKIDDD